ncbi:MAG: FAD-binding oxidoreductase [Alphaproteobacteria bacterium]
MTRTEDAAGAEARELGEALRRLLGPDNVLDDTEAREFFAQDLSNRRLARPALVIQPETVEDLAGAVRTATGTGFAVVPRGGGMSYTLGYLPAVEKSVSVDLRKLDRIVEINTDDMYVIVEAGVTWGQLHAALDDIGMRTPFWGTLSGYHATVGGSLAQDAALFGSGQFGTAAQSALGLELVLANGEILRTGSWANRRSTPFYRHWGPDLTGLFLADTGALGIKARISLQLVRQPPAMAAASFGFNTFEELVATQTEVTRMRVASECFGFDPYFNEGFEASGITLSEGFEILGKIAGSGRGLRGLGDLFRVTRAGKRVLRKVNYSLHVTVDGHDDGAAGRMMDSIRRVARENGAWELTNAIPTVMRAHPFRPIRSNLLGPKGQLWGPMHGIFPLSRAQAAVDATEAYLAENRQRMDEHGVTTSYLTAASANMFLLEPSFYWIDALGPLRLSVIEPEFQEKWKTIGANPAARDLVIELRQGIADLHEALGAVQQQIGKYYAFSRNMVPESWELLQGLKRQLDPRGLMNPGALGLG